MRVRSLSWGLDDWGWDVGGGGAYHAGEGGASSDFVAVFGVIGEPVAVPAVPLPGLLRGMGRVFVGRERELAVLEQQWTEASAGELRLALLAGEPGVGKTRLAGEIAARLHAGGATVLAGSCGEDLGVPYQPFVEALRHQVDHTRDDKLGSCLGRYPGELVRLMPELGEVVPTLPPPLRSDPETERYRLFDAVGSWLAHTSKDGSVLLVVDDLQWAAKPTLLLLRHVARFPEPMRVLVLGTYRDTEITRRHPLAEAMADFRRLAGFVRLSLGGLDRTAVLALMEEAGGHSLDAEEDRALAEAIHDETEGNPFFVKEVLRHLTETGAIRHREGRWVTGLPIAELGIPEGVRDVVGRRLSRLSDGTNQLLEHAAVVGVEFETAVLRSTTGLDQERLSAGIDEAVSARLVSEVPGLRARYRFSHALVRDTLYAELSGPRRMTLHKRVAEAIETVHRGHLEAHLPALTYHYARGAGPSAETHKAAEYAAQAGDLALAQLAHDEAAGYYHRALELLQLADGFHDDARWLELLLSLGEAQRRAGDGAYRQTLLDAAELARRRGDARALARAALANARGLLPSVLGRVDAERVAVLEAAVEALGDADMSARARLLATLGAELSFAGNWRRCLALSDEALALARSEGDPETLARVLLARYFPTCVPGQLDERLANSAELVALADTTTDPALKAEAHLLRARAAFEQGDMDEADRWFDSADHLSITLGQPALRWRVTYMRGARALAAGRFGDAERLIDESWNLAPFVGRDDAQWVYVTQIFAVRLEQGCLDDEILALLQAGHRKVDLPWNHAVFTLASCELGRHDEARAGLDRGLSTPVPFDIYWLVAMCNWADVAARLAEVDHAGRLYTALAPYATRAIPFVALPTPCVAHHLGLLASTLGQHDKAEHHFREALSLHERIGAPHWAARTRLEWGRMLLSRRRRPGDPEQAQLLLATAQREFQALGVDQWVRRADEVLTGLPPSKARLPGGLTEREAEILRLVAAGNSNKAIALQLALSPKTVDRHLSNIFTKIGVRSRAAATSFAHRQRIV